MSGPDPVVAAQRLAVRVELADLPAGSTVLVACSGGADSLALAAATAFVAGRGTPGAPPRRRPRDDAPLRAGAVVVDHGLQRGSAEVAERAAQQCRDLGLHPVEVVRVVVPAGAGAGGPELAARTARYAALEQAAVRHGAAVILLGHTLDDQAETVLLGLARGSGARSLSGMARRRGRLRRPFLTVRRAQTERACVAQGLTPWHDPTNGPGSVEHSGPTDHPGPTDHDVTTDDADRPLRSRVRHDVLPVLERVLGPGVAPALARTADQLRQDADLLDALAGELLGAARVDGSGADDEPPIVLSIAVLADAPPALRRRALRAAAIAAGAGAGSVHQVHVAAVEALATDWHGQGPVALPGGVRAVRRYGRLALGTSPELLGTDPSRPDAGPDITSATQGASNGGSSGHG